MNGWRLDMKRMEYQQLRGAIQEVRKVKLRGQNQRATLVLLETGQGNRAVVDLGTDVPVSLRQGSQLAVRGRQVTIGDQRVVLQANAVRYEGRTLDVNRPAMQRTSTAPSGQQTAKQQNRQQQASRQQGGSNRQQASDSQRNQQPNQQRNRQQTASQQSGGNQKQGNLRLGPYDANNDAQFSTAEISRALYDRFDRDKNGVLSVAEWDRGMDRIFGEGDINLSVQAWDPDGNDRISRSEFRTAMRQSGLFRQIDADRSGGISGTEFRQARNGQITLSAGADEEVAAGGMDRAPRGTPGATDADAEVSPYGIEANPSGAQLDVLEDEDTAPPVRDLSTMSGGG